MSITRKGWRYTSIFLCLIRTLLADSNTIKAFTWGIVLLDVGRWGKGGGTPPFIFGWLIPDKESSLDKPEVLNTSLRSEKRQQYAFETIKAATGRSEITSHSTLPFQCIYPILRSYMQYNSLIFYCEFWLPQTNVSLPMKPMKNDNLIRNLLVAYFTILSTGNKPKKSTH